MKEIKSGLPVLNVVWFSAIFIRLHNIQEIDRWVRLVMIAIVGLFLANQIGVVIKQIENTYLRGKMLSSGKYKIEEREK